MLLCYTFVEISAIWELELANVSVSTLEIPKSLHDLHVVAI